MTTLKKSPLDGGRPKVAAVGSTADRHPADGGYLPKQITLTVTALVCGIVAVCVVGCSSGTPIEEGEYVGGMPVDTAVVEPVPGGGYRTISGDPLIAVNGNIEQTSMLPYGGGDEGIRQAEDETPFYSTN